MHSTIEFPHENSVHDPPQFFKKRPPLANNIMDNSERVRSRKTQNPNRSPLNLQKTSQSYLQFTNSHLSSSPLRHFQKYELIVQNEHLHLEMQRVEWRLKTQLPILKVFFYKIQQKQLLNECSVLQVAIQNYASNLSTLPKLTYSQVLYLLRESLEGFSGLYQKFGAFEISSKMIMINKNQKCKVWMSDNITSSYPMKRSSWTEREAVCKIVSMMEEKCIRLTLLSDLFRNLQEAQGFKDALKILDRYLRINRITLPTKFSSPRETPVKYNQAAEEGEERKIHFGTSIFRKTPKFILQLREDKKQLPFVEEKGKYSLHKLPSKSILHKGSKQNKSFSPFSTLSNSKKSISPKSNNEIKATRSFKVFPRQKSQCLLVNNPKNEKQAEQNSQIPLKKPEEVYSKMSAQFQSLFQASRPTNNREIQASLLKAPIFSINSSQQTATSSNNSIVMAPLLANEKCEQTRKILARKGWQVKFDTLLAQNDDQTQLKESYHKGKEVFSQEYALTAGKLVYLQNMGKVVKQSLLFEQQ